MRVTEQGLGWLCPYTWESEIKPVACCLSKRLIRLCHFNPLQCTIIELENRICIKKNSWPQLDRSVFELKELAAVLMNEALLLSHWMYSSHSFLLWPWRENCHSEWRRALNVHLFWEKLMQTNIHGVIRRHCLQAASHMPGSSCRNCILVAALDGRLAHHTCGTGIAPSA